MEENNMSKKKCKYHKKYPLFQENSLTCNDKYAYGGYCGKFKQFNERNRKLKRVVAI